MRYFILAPNRNDLYWRPESKGYTLSLAEAGVYEEKEAKRIEGNKRGDRIITLESQRKELERLKEQAAVDLTRLDFLLSLE